MNRTTVRVAAMILALALTAVELGAIALIADYEVQAPVQSENTEVQALVAATTPTALDFICNSVDKAACCQPCRRIDRDRRYQQAVPPE